MYARQAPVTAATARTSNSDLWVRVLLIGAVLATLATAAVLALAVLAYMFFSAAPYTP